jgi:hypothetical protein
MLDTIAFLMYISSKPNISNKGIIDKPLRYLQGIKAF